MYKFQIYQPYLIGNEKKYVNECLESTWISSKGKFIKLFEEEFARFLGVKNAISVTNGTVALHLALLALGIGEGDEVIVPTLTYIASVNAIKYVGAIPVFIDSDIETWQMDANDILKKITRKTKAIIVVHLYGFMCDMEKIMDIAKTHNLYVIEDASEALGSKYNFKYAGSFGDIATFSFYGNKTITTGEGGMVVTNNYDLAVKVRTLKNQGIGSNKEYAHEQIGYNYRMTNICAAIGKAQLENIEIILKKKRDIAFVYMDELKYYPLKFLFENEKIRNSFWMVTISLTDASMRQQLRDFLADNGIETRAAFPPVHTFEFYKKYAISSYKNAEILSRSGLNLPSYPKLSKRDILYITSKIKNFFDNYK
jgi:perosamine synthetase